MILSHRCFLSYSNRPLTSIMYFQNSGQKSQNKKPTQCTQDFIPTTKGKRHLLGPNIHCIMTKKNKHINNIFFKEKNMVTISIQKHRYAPLQYDFPRPCKELVAPPCGRSSRSNTTVLSFPL